MNEAMREFVKEGLKRFPEALDAVVRFSASVKSVLEETLRSRSDQEWGSFRPVSSDSVKVGGPPLTGYCYLYGLVEGRFGEVEATLDLGLWWNPEGLKEPLIIYASVLYGPPELKKLNCKPRSQRVRAQIVEGKT